MRSGLHQVLSYVSFCRHGDPDLGGLSSGEKVRQLSLRASSPQATLTCRPRP